MRSVVRRFHGTREIERVRIYRTVRTANFNGQTLTLRGLVPRLTKIYTSLSIRVIDARPIKRQWNWRATSFPATRRARVTREERLELSLGQAKRYHRRRTGKVAGNPQRRNNLGLLVRHRRRHCDAGFAIKYGDRCVLGLRRES